MDTLKHPGRRYSPEEKSKIVELYNAGMPSSEIIKIIGCSKYTVLKILRSNNIKIRTNSESKSIYTLKHHVFSEINEESAYWVGFLMADGCVKLKKKGNPEIILGLSITDLTHLEKFKLFLGTNRPIGIYKNECKIGCHSKPIFDDLYRFGVVPKKTFVAKVSDDLKLNKNFWRGVIDGDGSIMWSKRGPYHYPVINLVGSEDLIEQFVTFLKIHIPNYKRKINRFNHTNVRSASITDVQQVLKMLDIMYLNSTIFLDRKYQKAINLINSQGKTIINYTRETI